MSFIGTNENNVDHVPSLVTINDAAPVKLCDVNDRRMTLRVSLPCTNDTICVVVAPTSQDAADLKGETLYQNFIGADNPYKPEVVFDVNTSAQGEKWAILDIVSDPASLELSVNEYIG